MGGMRRVRGVLGDDCAISLLRHDKPQQVHAYFKMGVRLKVGSSVFGRGRVNVARDRSISSLDRHAGERRERCAKRKHNFGFFCHIDSPQICIALSICLLTTSKGTKSMVLLFLKHIV